MFLAAVAFLVFTLACIAMCRMDSVFKAMMLLTVLLIATFVLFLFINYPLPSAISVVSLMILFATKIKL